MNRLILTILTAGLLLAGGGCAGRNRAAERFGKTFYLDGAGNWGFGAAEVPDGLRQAGYVGDVEIYVWTTSFFPLIDQLNIGAAKLRALALAQKIEAYRKEYPNNEINIIALSAGTGVAIWAVESLHEGVQINNLVLLGSSLSHDYDASQALANMTGKIYVYYSGRDTVLPTVRIVGTIDGRRGVDAAGSVGLRAPAGMEKRVVNTPWSAQWLKYGWTGSHTDCTDGRFVRNEIARHIVPPRNSRFMQQAGSGPPAMLTASAVEP